MTATPTTPFRLSRALLSILDALAAKLHVSRTEALRRAVRDYGRRHGIEIPED